MAQTNKTPILLYHSTVASAVPSNANLQAGELAMNIADMKLYTENSGGTVTLLASADAAAGNFTTVDTTNLEVTNIKAKDGTAAIVLTDSTGAVTVSSPFATTGNTTLGNASGDTVTITGTITSNLIFTDNTYDIGASGATRPRNLYLSGNATIGGSIAATTLDLTNLEVTNIKAKDGTASATIADSTGVMTIGSSVLTTTDINGGTIDGTAIGGSTPAAGAFTTVSATGQISGVATGNAINIAGATTLSRYLTLYNSGGGLIAGVESSAGGSMFAGSAAYAAAIGTTNVTPVQIASNNSVVASFSSTGLAVTGTISATGAVTFPAGTASLPSITTTGDLNTGIYFPAADTVGITTAGSERMRIDSSGNVGIGTASPSFRLDAVKDAAGLGRFSFSNPNAGMTQTDIRVGAGTNTNDMYFGVVSGDGFIDTRSTNSTLIFQRGGGEAMRISSTGALLVANGNIGSGNTTPVTISTSGGNIISFNNVASAVNNWYLYGNATGSFPVMSSNGSDTNVSAGWSTKGTGQHLFYTDATSALQVRIDHTASANRYITLTGSNGGNPTIGTSAGSLAISTDIAATGNAVFSNSTAEIQFTGATYGWLRSTVGHLYVDAPTAKNIFMRNAGNLILDVSGNGIAVTGYIEGTEQTAPAAAAANGYRIFAEDNGAGKTRLMVQFATGAAQQIAIQP